MNQPYRWLVFAFVVIAAAFAAGTSAAKVAEPRPVVQTPAAAPAAETTPAAPMALSPAEMRALGAEYAEAIRKKVVDQWVRPGSVPLRTPCRVHLRQLPGGMIVAAEVDPTCPFDPEGRRSVERAVLNASPLPYHGYESVFTYRITFTFVAKDLDEGAEGYPTAQER